MYFFLSISLNIKIKTDQNLPTIPHLWTGKFEISLIITASCTLRFRYDIGDPLGKGCNASVYEARIRSGDEGKMGGELLPLVPQ